MDNTKALMQVVDNPGIDQIAELLTAMRKDVRTLKVSVTIGSLVH